jgi:hypothetical protein
MDRRQERELLAAHADQLVAPNGGPPTRLTHFRRRLHGDLLLEAQRRAAVPEMGLFRQHRRGILIGAAAVGSVVSVVGVAVAFALRHRQRGATRIATG